jgi:hypothetical protein
MISCIDMTAFIPCDEKEPTRMYPQARESKPSDLIALILEPASLLAQDEPLAFAASAATVASATEAAVRSVVIFVFVVSLFTSSAQ